MRLKFHSFPIPNGHVHVKKVKLFCSHVSSVRRTLQIIKWCISIWCPQILQAAQFIPKLAILQCESLAQNAALGNFLDDRALSQTIMQTTVKVALKLNSTHFCNENTNTVLGGARCDSKNNIKLRNLWSINSCGIGDYAHIIIPNQIQISCDSLPI